MTNKRGAVKLFTFSFEIDVPNIISCAPKIFTSAPKNLYLVAQVLPNSNLNFEPCKHHCHIVAFTVMVVVHSLPKEDLELKLLKISSKVVLKPIFLAFLF